MWDSKSNAMEMRRGTWFQEKAGQICLAEQKEHSFLLVLDPRSLVMKLSVSQKSPTICVLPNYDQQVRVLRLSFSV